MTQKHTKYQQRLLRYLQEADKWWDRYPLVYLLYLLPILFLTSNLWAWFKLRQAFDYCLATRFADGEVRPVEVDLNVVMLWIVLSVGLALFVMSGEVVLLWRQKRAFKEIWRIREHEYSQQGAAQEEAR